LSGRFAVPGDKSLSHRALIFGALAEGETVIAGLLESADVLATAEALRAFGVRVEQFGPGRWRVIGGEWRSPEQPIDCGNSGTSARLLMGAAAGQGVRATFTGDASLSRRPMRRVRAPLEAMGVRFEGGDTLPLTVEGPATPRHRSPQRAGVGAGEERGAARRAGHERAGRGGRAGA
jgi:3-phosphoshikimate 1-carboxyvinyltransferase